MKSCPEELEDNDEWCMEDGLPLPQKRMLSAKWLSQAWLELTTEQHPALALPAYSYPCPHIAR